MAYEPESNAGGTTEELAEIREAAYEKIMRDEVRALRERWNADRQLDIIFGLVDGLPADVRRNALDVLDDRYPDNADEQAQG